MYIQSVCCVNTRRSDTINDPTCSGSGLDAADADLDADGASSLVNDSFLRWLEGLDHNFSHIRHQW